MDAETSRRNLTLRRLVLATWILVCGWLVIGLLVAIIHGVFFRVTPTQCERQADTAAETAAARCGSEALMIKRRL